MSFNYTGNSVKIPQINKGRNVYPTKLDIKGVIMHEAYTQRMNEFKGASFHTLSDLPLLNLKLR